MHRFNMKLLALSVPIFLGCSMIAASAANTPFPEFAQKHLHMQFTQIGKGTYRKFGFRVYEVTLWASGSEWDAKKPYALELHYTRDVDQETMSDTVIDDIRGQDVAQGETLIRWEKTLRDVLPEVQDGDTMIGVEFPGKNSLLFHNGKQIADIRDEGLSQAFFNVWLGDHADESLRAKLLGQEE